LPVELGLQPARSAAARAESIAFKLIFMRPCHDISTASKICEQNDFSGEARGEAAGRIKSTFIKH
jgi:hypothetical protein